MYPDYNVKKINSFRDLIEIMSSEHSSKIVFSCPNEEISYNNFVDYIFRFAKGILKIDYNKIRLDLNNAVNFASAYIATVLVGKIAILGESSLPISEDTLKIDDDSFFLYITDEKVNLLTLPNTNINEVCTILHSSGTSSSPKGIMLSQKNICSDVVSGLEKYSMKKEDRFINLIPYYHAFGIVCDLLGPLLVGATIHILENKKYFLAEIPRIKPTILNVPPVIAETLLKLIKTTGNVNKITGGYLRKILCGGAGLKANVSKELRQYGIFAYGCYGLSECSPCVAVNRDDYYKDGSAGVPLSCNKITIADDNEILISGTNVMLGYYNDLEATNKVIIDGVLHTGDLGYIDEDGFLFIIGRKSNLIVFSDGTKCSPETLEDQILANTSAEEVVVYQSDIENRPTLCAKIYLQDFSKKNSIVDFIDNMLISHKFDSIIFTEKPLPKNATGKIRRNT